LIYKLQYHKGAEILKALKDISSSLEKSPSENNRNLLSVIGSLQWIEVTNSLIASGESDILSKLKELIQSVDVPLRQVFIEVLVVETNLFNSQNFGLQWGSQLQYLNKTVGAMGNFPLPPGTTSTIGDSALNATPLIPSNIQNTTASNPPVQGSGSNNGIPFTSGFDLGVIGDIIMHKGKSFLSLGSLVNALQVDRDSTVVMNPKIITQDGHTSTIFVGQNIPFTGSFVSNTGSNATVQTSNIEYRDVGVNLTITPTLGTNNVITMQITQDISEQIPSTTTVQGSAVTGIQTSHTSMNTRVHVPDNHFLVLSGMIQNSKTNFRSGIPCLGGLPVVGALFAQNDRAASKTNVIIFVRPIIIDSFEDFDRITEEEEAMYKQNATLQILKEEFDDATEMIKALSNE
jgi:type III secretion protein C